jgi:hypothetical protein
MSTTPTDLETLRREKANAAGRKWAAKNRQKVRDRVKQWKLDNPDKARELLRKWKAKNKDKVRATNKAWANNNREKMTGRHLRRKYGLTLVEFRAMSAAQNHQCLICARYKKLCVDHCHTTNRVRGLLCQDCNKGLGCFREDPKAFRAAVKYLARKLP